MVQATVRAEHAAAVRRVNVEFARLPKSSQEALDLSDDPLSQEIDAAINSGDRIRALAAVAAWQDHWLDRFAEVSK